jgi:CelD/BcsL family acetyltransferase involved in cellulose biosynthesis
MSVVVIEDLSALDQYRTACEALAEQALEPNPFYEYWMLEPALRLFRPTDLKLVLVFAEDELAPSGRKMLCGLFPFERKRRYKGLPIKVLRLWRHAYCPLRTPLVHRERGREVIEALFNWLASNPRGCSVVEFGEIVGDGPFRKLIIDELQARGSLSFLEESHTRALLRRRAGAEEYLRESVSREHRKDLRRKQRRLSETGWLEMNRLDRSPDIEKSIEEFLALEASGWKGKEGGALLCDEAGREFFKSVAREASVKGRIDMLTLRLDGKPIAKKVNILAGDGAFAFKIAFDEQHARHSPGILLEIENIRRFHASAEVGWMDSCAEPFHPMINRLWLDRRIIETVIVATGRGAGEFWVSAIPLLRWLARKARGKRANRLSLI